jgi:hypothetical protein
MNNKKILALAPVTNSIAVEDVTLVEIDQTSEIGPALIQLREQLADLSPRELLTLVKLRAKNTDEFIALTKQMNSTSSITDQRNARRILVLGRDFLQKQAHETLKTLLGINEEDIIESSIKRIIEGAFHNKNELINALIEQAKAIKVAKAHVEKTVYLSNGTDSTAASNLRFYCRELEESEKNNEIFTKEEPGAIAAFFSGKNTKKKIEIKQTSNLFTEYERIAEALGDDRVFYVVSSGNHYYSIIYPAKTAEYEARVKKYGAKYHDPVEFKSEYLATQAKVKQK